MSAWRVGCYYVISYRCRTCLYYTQSLYYWGEPERAPPRDLQRLRSLSHNDDNDNGGGISYVLPNAHARSLRGEFKGQSRQQLTGEAREVSLRF